MRKKTMAVALSLFLVTPLATQAASYETEVERGVNFRTEPSTSSYVYRMIPSGEDIHVIDKVNNYWLKIQVQDGTVGYISANAKYTDYEESSSSTASGQIISGVNFRSAPSTSGTKIGFISRGTSVEVLEVTNSWWVKVRHDGRTGYVSSKYITYSSTSSTGSTSGTSTTSSQIADRIIAHAQSLIGKVSYDFGTRDPSRLIFDCSSFTEYVFEAQDVELKWGTRYQKYAGTAVSKSNLKKGDLVFFGTSSKYTINHVGIYMGNGQFIHNSPSSDGIQINNLNSGYWEDRYIKARRVL